MDMYEEENFAAKREVMWEKMAPLKENIKELLKHGPQSPKDVHLIMGVLGAALVELHHREMVQNKEL